MDAAEASAPRYRPVFTRLDATKGGKATVTNTLLMHSRKTVTLPLSAFASHGGWHATQLVARKGGWLFLEHVTSLRL